MGFGNWVKSLFRGKPMEATQVPEILGYETDERGERQAIHRGWIKHEGLSDDQVQRVARLREVLAEAYPMTLEGWIDGFLRDSDPETEIQVIEACSVVYQQLGEQTNLSTEQKKQLYAVLCAVSAGADGTQLAAALRSFKGLPRLDDIVSMYREARYSGSRP